MNILAKKGTSKHNEFENELSLDILATKIKQLREDKNLTQSQLGELVGVQKA